MQTLIERRNRIVRTWLAGRMVDFIDEGKEGGCFTFRALFSYVGRVSLIFTWSDWRSVIDVLLTALDFFARREYMFVRPLNRHRVRVALRAS